MTETWKALEKFPRYEVSSKGRARSSSVRGRAAHKILTLLPSTNGYLYFAAYRDGVRRNVYVHVAMLETFVGPRPSGMQACHGDDVRNNNVLSNLRWGTPKTNSADAKKNGVYVHGEKHGYSKLTDQDVLAMRADAKKGVKRVVLAKRYGITPWHATLVIRGRFWKHI